MDFGSFEIGIIISDVVMFADVNVGCVPRLTAVLKAGSTDRGPDFCLKGPLIDRRLRRRIRAV